MSDVTAYLDSDRLTRKAIIQRGVSLGVAASSFSLLAACGSGGESGSSGDLTGTIRFLNYPDFVGSKEYANFAKKYPGASVKEVAVDQTSISATAQQVLKNRGTYDVVDAVLPTVGQLEAAKETFDIDESDVPNLKHVDPAIREAYCTKGIPILSGVSGIAYRRDLVTEELGTWDDLWRIAPKYSRKILFIGVDRNALGIGLVKLGYDVNSKDEAELTKAKDELLKIKPHVKAFKVSGLADPLINGAAAIAVTYNYEAGFAMPKNSNIKWVVPEGPAVGFVEGNVPLKSSKHQELALAFLNTRLEPRNQASYVETLGYPPVVTNALPFIKKNRYVATDKVFRLPQGLAAYKYLGPEGDKLVSRIWNEFQSA